MRRKANRIKRPPGPRGFEARPGSWLLRHGLHARQLQYFIAVAEEGTVSGAAQTSISQSAVTEAVKELEADLGVELFERHRAAWRSPTRATSSFAMPPSILADVSDARRTFADDRSAATGRLHLGVTSLVAGYVLSDLLARYRRAFPAVEVSAIEDNGEYLEHLLIGGELDVAVMVISNLRDRMALQAEILEASPYRLWLPLGHPLASADIIERRRHRRRAADHADRRRNRGEHRQAALGAGRRPHVAFRTRSVEAVRSLVATGAGVALLPDLVYRPWSLEGDRIESRDVSGALPVVQVGVVWRTRLAPAGRGAGFHRDRAGRSGRAATMTVWISEFPISTILILHLRMTGDKS